MSHGPQRWSRSWLPGALAAVLLLVLAPAAEAVTLLPGDILVTDSGLDAVLRVNPISGDRTVVSGCVDAACSSVVGTSTGGAEIISPFGITQGAGGEIYIVDTNLDAVIEIDPVTGNRSIVSSASVGSGTAFQSPVGVTFDKSTGDLFVVDQTIDGVFQVDLNAPNRGDRTLLPKPSGAPSFTTAWDIMLEGPNDLLVSDLGLGAIFRISASDGAREIISGCTDAGCTSPVGGGDLFGSLRSLAVEADGGIVATDSGLDSVFSVDPLTGDRVVISSSTVGSGRNLEFPLGTAVEDVGTLIVADFQLNALLRVDPANMGNRSLLSYSQQGSGPEFDSPRRVTIVPIPEPGTVVSLGLGLLALWRVSAARRSRESGGVGGGARGE